MLLLRTMCVKVAQLLSPVSSPNWWLNTYLTSKPYHTCYGKKSNMVGAVLVLHSARYHPHFGSKNNLCHRKRRKCDWIQRSVPNTFLSSADITTQDCFNLITVLLYLKTFPLRLHSWESHHVWHWYSDILCSPGCIVEINEAKFGKRKYNQGRRIDEQWDSVEVHKVMSNAYGIVRCSNFLGYYGVD